MITFYAPGKPRAELTSPELCSELTRTAVWIDLLEPTLEEEQALEAALGLDVPTREEMQAIEPSSRLYEEKGVLYMTATVLTNSESERPQSAAITFILATNKLITLRYVNPAPFATFAKRRESNLEGYQTPSQFLGGLIDGVIERIADILEGAGARLDGLSARIFGGDNPEVAVPLKDRLSQSPRGEARRARQRDYNEVLRLIGVSSDLISRERESLVSFTRLVAFFREVRGSAAAEQGESLAHLKTISGDLTALSDHASFLGGKLTFLLDATLGMIANEQNAIIKILSVAALVFLPPTLIAGIYGMNFHVLPELNWHFGYPFALVLMLASAVLPYLFFKRRGWL